MFKIYLTNVKILKKAIIILNYVIYVRWSNINNFLVKKYEKKERIIFVM